MFLRRIETLERALANTHTDPRVLILRLDRVPFIDITGIQAIEEVILDMHHRGVPVVRCEANQPMSTKLQRASLTERQSNATSCGTLDEALFLAGRNVGASAVSRVAS